MNNEELEREVKRLEEQITKLRFKILESKAEKKHYEVEAPEDIDDYVYINNFGSIFDSNGFTVAGFEKIYKRGLTFKTVEEVEQYDKERILMFKLHKWAEEHNGGWTPNWKDLEEEKWAVMYDNKYKIFEIYENCRYLELLKLPYFKSEEIAEQFIEEFGEEIKEVLC